MENQDKMEHESEKYFLDEQQRIFEIARSTQVSLWNALFSINAIIITVFTGLLSLKDLANRYLLLSIISICVLSALLILINFIVTKRFYFNHSENYLNKLDQYCQIPETELPKYHTAELNKIENTYKCIVFSECTSIILVIIELILIVVFVFI